MKTTKKFNKISEKRFLNAQFVNSISVFKNKNNTCNCQLLLEWYCLNLRSKFMLPQNQICED